MPKVYTIFDLPEKKATPPGDEFLEVFQEEIDKDGNHNLVCTGKTNIYQKIQEEAPSTLIENILAACAMGDYSRIREQEPVYIDATTLPKNLMECENIVLKAKQQFENYPSDIKELFNNNPDKYLSEMGTEEFFKKMTPYSEKIRQIEEAGSMKKYNQMVAERAKFEKDVEAAKGGTE